MNRRLNLNWPRLGFLAGCAALLLLSLALRWPSLGEPRWYRDEGIFAAVAQDLRHGDMLYSGAWDNKPPLIFYTYAAIQSLFSSGVFPLHAVTTVVVLLTELTVIAIALRIGGRIQALAAGTVFAVVTCTPVIEGNLAMTETYMILPATLAVLLMIAQPHETRSKLSAIAIAGVLISIAASYKQVAAFDGLAIAVFLWLSQERPARALTIFTGAVVTPQLAFAAYFLAVGSLPEYWYAVVGSLPLYADLGPQLDPLERLSGLLPALLVVAWLVRARAEGHTKVGVRHLPVLWLAFTIAGATSSSLEFPHYLMQAAPSFALTIVLVPAIVPTAALDRLTLGVAGFLAVTVVVAQFAPEIQARRQLHPLPYYRNYLEYRQGDRDHQRYERFFDGSGESVRDIAAAIQKDGGGTTLYTWSELPWLYAAGDFTNPTRFYTSFLGELVPGAKVEILEDLEAHPPAYIVISDTTYAPFPELDDFVAERYVPLQQQGDWRLYRLMSGLTNGPRS